MNVWIIPSLLISDWYPLWLIFKAEVHDIMSDSPRLPALDMTPRATAETNRLPAPPLRLMSTCCVATPHACECLRRFPVYITSSKTKHDTNDILKQSHSLMTEDIMETHLHVKSVLCHFRPVRAYRLLLLLLSMSSPPTMSGSEHRGVAISLSVASSETSHGFSDATCTRTSCDLRGSHAR